MTPQAIEQAREIIARGRIKAFSFDIFDTVLLRRCATPHGVYERMFSLLPVPTARRKLGELFVQHRSAAELKAREIATAKNGSPEVPIKAIHKHFPVHIFGLKVADAPLLVEAEFQAERELCFANPDVVELIREARAKGIRAGFLSNTYWPEERLTALLRGCAPDLEWDFLYASCDHETGKTEKLFQLYLKKEKLEAGSAVHMGDNEMADIAVPRKLGLQVVHYPQAGPSLNGIFQRETFLFNLLCAPTAEANRLDGGARTLRRAVAGRAPTGDPAFSYGVEVLGPIMTAFDRFAADRVARLTDGKRRVAVAFLGRDGLLPHAIWQASRDDPIHYVEVNRRVAMIGAATSLEPIAESFRLLRQMNLAMAVAFLKSETPRMRRFFKRHPDGIVSGDDFADALPELIDEAQIAAMAQQARQQILAHLRRGIPDFDGCTDLVLVDLGYSGTVQKALRDILEHEGYPQRLHGLYLLTVEEAFGAITEPDSVEGLVSDAVLSLQAKRALLKNIAPLEQLCGDGQGSVLAYNDDGTVQREPDKRPQSQLDLCARIREGALHFAREYTTLTAGGYPDGFADLDTTASWTAALLARALLLPTDDELLLLGSMQHDVNMGSQALASTADPRMAHAFDLARPLQVAFSMFRPPVPMWMAASMAGVSPMHGFLYALYGAGHLPADIVGDSPMGTTDIVLISGNDGHPLTVASHRNGFGDLRFYIPLPGKANMTAVVIPASALPPHAIIRGIALQSGTTATEAMASPQVTRVPSNSLQALRMTLHGDLITHGGEEDAHLVIPIPPFGGKIAVMTVNITPLDGMRLLASTGQA